MLTSQNNDPRWILATIVESGNCQFWGWHELFFVTFFLLLFFLRTWNQNFFSLLHGKFSSASPNSNECHFGYHCQWQVSNCCNLQRGIRNKLISNSLYNCILNPLTAASSNPLGRGSWGWGKFVYQNHAARWENGSSWWGWLCDVCFTLAKRHPSGSFNYRQNALRCWDVDSLTAIDAHECQLFNELVHWWLVTSLIFVRC